MGKHTLQGEMYANSIGKNRFFAVHTDFDQIPADVAAVAKLVLQTFLPVLLPESMHRSAKTSSII